MTMPAQRVARRKEIKIYLYVATLATFAIGYADLIRGGISVSALLLAIGYCVLIPLDIWVDGAPASSGTDQPPYGAAAVAAAAVLVLYLLTMAPSTAMWDTSEYITAA